MIEQASLQRGKRFSVHIWWYFEIYNSVPTGRVTKLALHRTLAGGRNYIVCCSFWAREMDWMWLFFCGKVLLLDEITVDLDVLARADLVAFLKSECEERGATIIYATHIFDGLESWPSHLVMFSLTYSQTSCSTCRSYISHFHFIFASLMQANRCYSFEAIFEVQVWNLSHQDLHKNLAFLTLLWLVLGLCC